MAEEKMLETSETSNTEVILRITKGTEVTERRSNIPADNTLETLIVNLKAIKETANDLLTVLVNEEKGSKVDDKGSEGKAEGVIIF